MGLTPLWKKGWLIKATPRLTGKAEVGITVGKIIDENFTWYDWFGRSRNGYIYGFLGIRFYAGGEAEAWLVGGFEYNSSDGNVQMYIAARGSVYGGRGGLMLKVGWTSADGRSVTEVGAGATVYGQVKGAFGIELNCGGKQCGYNYKAQIIPEVGLRLKWWKFSF